MKFIFFFISLGTLIFIITVYKKNGDKMSSFKIVPKSAWTFLKHQTNRDINPRHYSPLFGKMKKIIEFLDSTEDYLFLKLKNDSRYANSK